MEYPDIAIAIEKTAIKADADPSDPTQWYYRYVSLFSLPTAYKFARLLGRIESDWLTIPNQLIYSARFDLKSLLFFWVFFSPLTAMTRNFSFPTPAMALGVTICLSKPSFTFFPFLSFPLACFSFSQFFYRATALQSQLSAVNEYRAAKAKTKEQQQQQAEQQQEEGVADGEWQTQKKKR